VNLFGYPDQFEEARPMVFKHNPGKLLKFEFCGSKLSYCGHFYGGNHCCPVLIGVLPLSGFG